MAKLKATEMAKQIALEGMQMMGGYGYATEYDMERHVRTTLVIDDLRRHQRDPARDHLQDDGAVGRRTSRRFADQDARRLRARVNSSAGNGALLTRRWSGLNNRARARGRSSGQRGPRCNAEAGAVDDVEAWSEIVLSRCGSKAASACGILLYGWRLRDRHGEGLRTAGGLLLQGLTRPAAAFLRRSRRGPGPSRTQASVPKRRAGELERERVRIVAGANVVPVEEVLAQPPSQRAAAGESVRPRTPRRRVGVGVERRLAVARSPGHQPTATSWASIALRMMKSPTGGRRATRRKGSRRGRTSPTRH